jgi:hypothetical protein
MGDSLVMDVTCGNCPDKGSFKWTGSLATVEVSTVEDERDLGWDYVLRRPIHIRNKKVEKLRCVPPPWSVANDTPPGSEELARLAMLRASIIGINDEPSSYLSDDELDELSKPDLELLTQTFDDNWIGPKMSVEGHCPNCEREFKRPINWKYESFFGVSSV